MFLSVKVYTRVRILCLIFTHDLFHVSPPVLRMRRGRGAPRCAPWPPPAPAPSPGTRRAQTWSRNPGEHNTSHHIINSWGLWSWCVVMWFSWHRGDRSIMIYNDPGYLLYFNQLLVQVHQRFCPRDEAVKVVKQAEIIVKVVKGNGNQ